MLPPDQVRRNLDRLATERGFSRRQLSLAIRRNEAYVHQFITRGSPERLEERDRGVIAGVLGCDERELGAPEHEGSRGDEVVYVRRLRVEASAGPGTFAEDEAVLDRFAFPLAWLRRLTGARSKDLSIIRVRGDSMVPALADGAEALVDQSRRDPRGGEGVYVLRRDDALLVKRLTVAPGSGLITVSSDNPAHPTWRDCQLDTLRVVGRVVASVQSVG